MRPSGQAAIIPQVRQAAPSSTSNIQQESCQHQLLVTASSRCFVTRTGAFHHPLVTVMVRRELPSSLDTSPAAGAWV